MQRRSLSLIALGGVLLIVSMGALQRLDGCGRSSEGLAGAVIHEEVHTGAGAPMSLRPSAVDHPRRPADPSPEPTESTPWPLTTLLGDRWESSHTLHFIDARTGTALPGTEVWIARGEPIDDHVGAEDFRVALDEEALARELGQRFEAGPMGELLVGVDHEWLYVSARHGDLWGGESFNPGPGWDHEIELSPDQTLTIQVVDAAGTPRSGVPVALLLEYEEDCHYTLWRGMTRGNDGLAVVHHYQLRVDEGREDELSATFAFPPLDTDRVPVSKVDPPAEAVRLILPATGSLVVRVEDVHGQPWPEEGFVHAWEGVGDDRESEPFPGLEHKVVLRNGRAVFPHVGLGLELIVGAKSGRGFRPAEARFRGPTEPGERVEVTLRFAEHYPILTGRLLLSDGEPLVEQHARWRLVALKRTAEERPYRGYCLTDQEGRFRIALKGELPPGSYTLHLDPRVDRLAPHQGCGLTLPLSEGEHDLGVLQLEASTLLVAGRVIDECARPVADERVTLMRAEEYEIWAGDHHHGRQPGREVRTDPDGAFAFYGSPEPGAFLLFSTHCPRWPPTIPVSLGDHQVLVETDQGSLVTGTVLVDRGISANRLWLTIRPTGPMGGGTRTEADVTRSGHFRFRGLGPGVYEILVHRRDSDFPPLLDPIVIDVAPCEEQRPPALQGIDLRGLLYVYRLRVVDRDRRPLSGEVMYISSGEPDARVTEYDFSGGQCVLDSHTPAVDIAVACPGYGIERLQGLDADREIVMRPALDVRIRVEGEITLPELVHLVVRFDPVEIDGELEEGSLSHELVQACWEKLRGFVDGGEAAVELPAGGTWQLTWLVCRREGRGASWRRIPQEVPTRVTIEDLDGRQELWVTAPLQESIDRAVQSLER